MASALESALKQDEKDQNLQTGQNAHAASTPKSISISDGTKNDIQRLIEESSQESNVKPAPIEEENKVVSEE